MIIWQELLQFFLPNYFSTILYIDYSLYFVKYVWERIQEKERDTNNCFEIQVSFLYNRRKWMNHCCSKMIKLLFGQTVTFYNSWTILWSGCHLLIKRFGKFNKYCSLTLFFNTDILIYPYNLVKYIFLIL